MYINLLFNSCGCFPRSEIRSPFDYRKVRLTGSSKFSLELVIAAELGVDHGSDLASCDATSVSLHAIPVEGVVPALGGVVEKALVGTWSDRQ